MGPGPQPLLAVAGSKVAPARGGASWRRAAGVQGALQGPGEVKQAQDTQDIKPWHVEIG